MSQLRPWLVTFALIAFSAPAVAQVEVDIDSPNGATAEVTLTNGYDFAVKVVNVRVEFPGEAGARSFYYSQGALAEDLEPGDSWTGSLTFNLPEGSDLAATSGTLAAAGIDIAATAAPGDAALAGTDIDAVKAALTELRPRINPVSAAARLFADQIAASGVDRAAWFDFERLDTLRTSLEDRICEDASRRLLAAGGASARQAIYDELAPELREIDLHITCINDEAKLAAARMMIANGRPQDALVFSQFDDNGQPLPEWRPIYIEATLALARTAAEMNVTAMSSVKPALESLNRAREFDPTNPQLAEVAQAFIPLATRFVRESVATEPPDLESAREILTLLRPTWSSFAAVEEVAGLFAQKLLDSGLRYCERREFINARNEFIRGERILEGVPAWDENADQINHCRALGSLQEGREMANHPTDPEAPARGFEKLEEATRRYRLTDEEINAFKTDIANAHVAVAEHALGEGNFAMVRTALGAAEAMNPAGKTDAMREVWLGYAEKLTAARGILITGTDVADVREALTHVDDYAPDRVSAVNGSLSRTFYLLRVVLPASILGLIIAAIVFARARAAAAKRRFAAEAD